MPGPRLGKRGWARRVSKFSSSLHARSASSLISFALAPSGGDRSSAYVRRYVSSSHVRWDMAWISTTSSTGLTRVRAHHLTTAADVAVPSTAMAILRPARIDGLGDRSLSPRAYVGGGRDGEYEPSDVSNGLDTPSRSSIQRRDTTTRHGTSARVTTASEVDPKIARSSVPCRGRAARTTTVAWIRDAYRRICSAGVDARRRDRGLPAGRDGVELASGSSTHLCDPGSAASLRRRPSLTSGGSHAGSAVDSSGDGVASGSSSLEHDLGSHTRSSVISSSLSRKYFPAQVHASQASSA